MLFVSAVKIHLYPKPWRVNLKVLIFEVICSQIWKQKLQQLGAALEERWSKHLTHVFAANVETLTEKLGSHKLGRRKMVLREP